MKKIVLILTLLTTVITHAQTDGLSYQAVIIDSNVQELPWQDATGNILPNEVITLRFSILDESGSIEYQETQETRTDAFGMVNLIIGQGTPSTGNRFTDVFWGGSRKELQVEVSFKGQFSEIEKKPEELEGERPSVQTEEDATDTKALAEKLRTLSESKPR